MCVCSLKSWVLLAPRLLHSCSSWHFASCQSSSNQVPHLLHQHETRTRHHLLRRECTRTRPSRLSTRVPFDRLHCTKLESCCCNTSCQIELVWTACGIDGVYTKRRRLVMRIISNSVDESHTSSRALSCRPADLACRSITRLGTGL